MRELSSSARSFSYGETSWEAGDSTIFSEKQKFQALIEKANSVPIINIFRFYHLKLDEINKKTTCPFKSHKNGRENTPSFYWYPQTNTYCCYGCRQGSHPVDFVVYMDGCTRIQAAHKIIKIFSSEIEEDAFTDRGSLLETLQIMMKFSNAIREFRMNFSDDISFCFIEDKCSVFDKINQKHNLSNEALSSVIEQLLDAIKNYKL